ncbi:MAG: hypothetical protein ACI8RZ_003833 [Myxococcota bacterium]
MENRLTHSGPVEGLLGGEEESGVEVDAGEVDGFESLGSALCRGSDDLVDVAV